MTSNRLLLLWVAAFAMMGGACSNNTSGSPTGSGGKSGQGGTIGNGGTASQGGSTSTGGSSIGSGGIGSGGAMSAAGGTISNTGGKGSGGTSPSLGGNTSAGGTGSGGTVAGSGGLTGAGGVDSGVPSTGGRSAGGSTGGGSGTATGGSGTATGGTTGSAGSSGGGYAIGNPAVPSDGCGKTLDSSLKNGASNTITSGGTQRSYIIDIPTNYDMNKPYRLFFTFHWIGSSDTAVQGQNFYFLKPLATAANQPAIFIAPQALPGNPNGTWDTSKDTDQVFFDDLLAFAKKTLCFDVSRVFITGFSFGGMMTYSLSVNHQKDIRAAVGIAPANYNIYVPTKTHQPIAWMQTTGMSDCTCPWVEGQQVCGGTPSTTNGSKYIAIEHGTDNGCTVPNPIPTWTSGAHVCVDFTGCKDGYPTKVCTFNGPHTNINSDPGSSTNWIPQVSWEFFTQF